MGREPSQAFFVLNVPKFFRSSISRNGFYSVMAVVLYSEWVSVHVIKGGVVFHDGRGPTVPKVDEIEPERVVVSTGMDGNVSACIVEDGGIRRS